MVDEMLDMDRESTYSYFISLVHVLCDGILPRLTLPLSTFLRRGPAPAEGKAVVVGCGVTSVLESRVSQSAC